MIEFENIDFNFIKKIDIFLGNPVYENYIFIKPVLILGIT